MDTKDPNTTFHLSFECLAELVHDYNELAKEISIRQSKLSELGSKIDHFIKSLEDHFYPSKIE